MRRAAPLALLALAACGGPKTTVDAAAQNVIEATAKGTPAAIAAGSCDTRPVFAAIYDNATVTSCTSARAGPDARSGTILYNSAAAPTTILNWSRERALRAGLALQIEDGRSISAGQGEERRLHVTALPDGGSGSTVTVDWNVKD